MPRLLPLDRVLRKGDNLLDREIEVLDRDAERERLLLGALAGHDADDRTVGVEDRTAGIAGVDRDPELIVPLSFERRLGAHQSPADRVFEDQLAPRAGVADHGDVFALAERVGRGDAEGRQRRLHPEEREVAARVFVE